MNEEWKIYTKQGDSGQTALIGGKRIFKDDARIEAYGTIDELCAFTGHLYDIINIEEAKKSLLLIQEWLFNAQSIIACDPEKKIEIKLPEVTKENIKFLENQIDAMEKELKPLQSFILPSGHPQVSMAHVCRTVCRRAERRIITAGINDNADKNVVKFINRLSDYFFVLARFIANNLQIDEICWNCK